MPYGFPDGRSLMLDIANNVINNKDFKRSITGAGFDATELLAFGTALNKGHAIQSVDAFLERREEFVTVAAE